MNSTSATNLRLLPLHHADISIECVGTTIRAVHGDERVMETNIDTALVRAIFRIARLTALSDADRANLLLDAIRESGGRWVHIKSVDGWLSAFACHVEQFPSDYETALECSPAWMDAFWSFARSVAGPSTSLDSYPGERDLEDLRIQLYMPF